MTFALLLLPLGGILIAGTPHPRGIERDVANALGLRGVVVQTLELPSDLDRPVDVIVSIDGQRTALSLERHSVRAQGFELREQRADGSFVTVDPGPVTSFRGGIADDPSVIVAGALLADGMHARIVRGGAPELWIQPVPRWIRGARPGDHVLFERDAILPSGARCATGHRSAEERPGLIGGSRGGGYGAGRGAQLFTSELGVDADYEYFLAYGSSTSVSNRIQAVVNTVNLQYEADVDITHSITTILVRTSANQPYTSSDPDTLLDQFQDHWNASHGSIQRDVAQLFTGKSLSGFVGYARIGVVCNRSVAYGLAQSDFNGNFASATDLSAHELGHNWNATHCSCLAYTMNPIITSSNTFDPNGTRDDIRAFRDSRSCLSVDSTGLPPVRAFASNVPNVNNWSGEAQAAGRPSNANCNQSSPEYATNTAGDTWLRATDMEPIALGSGQVPVAVHVGVMARFDINEPASILFRAAWTRDDGSTQSVERIFDLFNGSGNGDCRWQECNITALEQSWSAPELNSIRLRVQRFGSFPNNTLRVKGFRVTVDPSACGVATGCATNPNATGARTALWGNGTPSLNGTFGLTISSGPPNQFGILWWGTSVSPASNGNGNLCLGMPQRLAPLAQFSGSGSINYTLDLRAPSFSNVQAGMTIGLQFQHRDPLGPPATQWNWSNALLLTVCP